MATSKATTKRASNGKKSTTANSVRSLFMASALCGKENEEQGTTTSANISLVLKAWRLELMEEVENMTHMKDEAANFPDPADRATQEEFSLELRTRDRERKLIKKIDKTLIRVEEELWFL